MIGNDKDEYAILLMTDVAVWRLNFTTNAFVLNTEIDTLTEGRLRTYVGFDMQSLGDTLQANLRLQDVDYYYQAIVIYGRSSLPTLPTNNVMKNLRKRNNFMLDLLFLHGKGSIESTQDVYDKWNTLDESMPNGSSGWFYNCNLFTGKDQIARAFSELIGHPAYRGTQSDLKREI
ncbi:hypothetical protein MBANPS3_007227 [Mucor bainieri]